MSKSTAFENSLLLLLFNNTNIANVGDATGVRGSTTAGQLFMALHSADPGEGGTQATSEIAYTSYTRIGVNRAAGAGGFTITASAVATASVTGFPAGTGGSGSATHWSLGVASSGATVQLYRGAISPAIVCGNGITPSLSAGTIVTEA